MLSIYDASPEFGDANLLATTRGDHYGPYDDPCPMLFFDILKPSAYFLVIEGRAESDEGTFELGITCNELAGPPVDRSCGMYSVLKLLPSSPRLCKLASCPRTLCVLAE